MKNRNVFWGIVVLLIGVLLLLNTLGILSFSIWQIFWPVMLILAGLWFLFGSIFVKPNLETVSFSHPLANIKQAEIKLHHGAGELNISALSSENHEQLLDGTFGGGMEHEVSQQNGLTILKLRAPVEVFPFAAFPHLEGYHWDMAISQHVPLQLRLHTGANKSSLNLHDLNVTELKLETGASDTEVILPAVTEYTYFKVQSGAASVNIRVPQGVAAKIRINGALMGNNIDLQRFPLVSGDPGKKLYQSADYEASAKQVEIKVDAGVGSINIH
jgi:predicted membrane protein